MSADNPFSPLTLAWRLRPGVSLEPWAEAGLVVSVKGGGSMSMTPHAGVRRALLAMGTGIGEDRLLALAGEEAASLLFYTLAQLVRLGLLEASADRAGVTAIRLVPRRRDFDLPRPLPLPQRVVLDRFACLRRTEQGAVLQAPEAPCDLIFEQPSCSSLIPVLAAGAIESADAGDPVDRPVLLLLVALGFATDADAGETPARRTWEFHDRLFHRAARSYDDGIVRGGTYRFYSVLPAPPALRPAHAGPVIELPSPKPQQLTRSRSLHEIMEHRRSHRAMAMQPVGLEELGELLYRVARVTALLPPGDIAQECLLRPYPSGGAIHELEFYLAIRVCTGLPPGFYHYRGDTHVLTRLADSEAPAAAMLTDCARAWGQPDQPPQVLVVIASRLPRLAWKYQGIAYKMSLMNAGVALQSLYLVATDLGLAGCAAGSGDPDLFARVTGADPWEETSIAEFGVGRPE